MIDKYANIETLTFDSLKNTINTERDWCKAYSKLNNLIMTYADKIILVNKSKEKTIILLNSMSKKGEEYKKLSNLFLNCTIELVLLKEKKQNVINRLDLIITHVEQQILNDQNMIYYQEILELFGNY